MLHISGHTPSLGGHGGAQSGGGGAGGRRGQSGGQGHEPAHPVAYDRTKGRMAMAQALKMAASAHLTVCYLASLRIPVDVKETFEHNQSHIYDETHSRGGTEGIDQNKNMNCVNNYTDGAEEEEDLCCVCLDRPKTVVPMPCRHMWLCLKCSARMRLCPLCKAAIAQKIQPFE